MLLITSQVTKYQSQPFGQILYVLAASETKPDKEGSVKAGLCLSNPWY